MTGYEIQQLRNRVNMDVAHFAQLLGVHPSTLYRWEAMESAQANIEPFQLQILAVLEQELERQQQVAPPEPSLGDAIAKGVLVGGALYGLFKLLDAAFGEGSRRTGGAVSRAASARTRSSPKKPRRR